MTQVEILKWLAGASDLTPESVVTVTDDLLVAITARGDGRGAERSTRLTLREEIINPDAATALGGRSVELNLDLDCSSHRLIVGARRIFERPNLQGPVRISRSDNVWVQTPADTVIDEVARAACSSAPPAPLIAPQPIATSFPRLPGTPVEFPVAAQAQPAAPAPPAEVRQVSADPPAPAPKAALSAGAPLRAQFAVQIAAVASADLARDVWQSLKARLPDLIGPLTFAAEPMSSQGRTQYRALLLGFGSPDEATALCKTLRTRSVDCILRQMR